MVWRDFCCSSFVMVARSPNSERKMGDDLPDMNVAAEFYARYDIREVLGKLVFTLFGLLLFYVFLW